MWTRIWWVRGVQLQAHQGAAMGSAQDLVAGTGALPGGVDPPCHQRAGHRADGGVHDALRRDGSALAYRQIAPAKGTRVQRALEALLRVGVLGDHHQAAGAPVQPVDGVIVGALTRLIVIIQEKITQRIVKMPRARMAGDAGALLSTRRSASSYTMSSAPGADTMPLRRTSSDTRTESSCPAAAPAGPYGPARRPAGYRPPAI